MADKDEDKLRKAIVDALRDHAPEVNRIGPLADALMDAIERAGHEAKEHPTTMANLAVTAEDHNAAFDPANDALGGAFKDGFREGWLFAKDPCFDDREELEADYSRAVDIAPSECWDAYRSHYFAMLPLAAIPDVGEAFRAPAPHVAGPWSISSQGNWYVENTRSHSYTTVGISKDGTVKALAVSTGSDDEGDFIVAALNFYEKHLSQAEVSK